MADASALVISSPHTSLYRRRNSSSRSGETSFSSSMSWSARYVSVLSSNPVGIFDIKFGKHCLDRIRINYSNLNMRSIAQP
jgi:hypothetical protein